MTRGHGSLVVGIDGSPGSLAALRWTVRQARLLRVNVVAVHAWQPRALLRAHYALVVNRPTPQTTGTSPISSSSMPFPAFSPPSPTCGSGRSSPRALPCLCSSTRLSRHPC